VNRLSVHPNDNVLMLSASQDGTMKLWVSDYFVPYPLYSPLTQQYKDLRTSSCKYTFDGKAESVRDVQFNPNNPFEFACAFDSGSLQKWDLRMPLQYERKWNAHNGIVLSLDWHADGRRLATGGRDRLVKVCNLFYLNLLFNDNDVDLGYKI
jgi:WD repeat-containing protein 24